MTVIEINLMPSNLYNNCHKCLFCYLQSNFSSMVEDAINDIPQLFMRHNSRDLRTHRLGYPHGNLRWSHAHLPRCIFYHNP